MSPKCCKCNNKNIDNEIYNLTCDSCGGYLHEKCSGLTATELRCIPLKTRTLMLLCEGCRGRLKSFPKMVKVMDKMQSQIAAVFKEIKEAEGNKLVDDQGVVAEVGGAGGANKDGGGCMKKMILSPELAALVGKDFMARHEVIKKIWAIIKEKGLYDPKDKSYAICDDALMKVIGVKRFRTFGMMKYLKTHFIS